MSETWVLITPAPGQRGFSPVLLAALSESSAPSHVWLATELRGFAMRIEDYRRWMEGSGPIEVVSPSHVKMFQLACGPALEAALELIQGEAPGIKHELVSTRAGFRS